MQAGSPEPDRLYVCYGTWGAGHHACGSAHEALKDAGYDVSVQRAYGSRLLPRVPFNLTPGRREVLGATGKLDVPALRLRDGSWVSGSREIAEWAARHPAR